MQRTKCKKIISFILSLVLLAFCTFIHAQTTGPILLIKPTSSITSTTLSSNGSTTVDYTVTNNTPLAVSGILITPNFNISSSFLIVTTSNNTCTGTLNPNASCTFTANLKGVGQTGSIILMPQVCGYNGLLCSVPASNNRVVVTITSSPGLSVNPSSGPSTGGQTVVITGTNFTGTTSVTFGGNNAIRYTVDSATQITAVTPPGTVGRTEVAVTSAGGTETGTYTYYQGNAFVVNDLGRNISVCPISPNGDFGTCSTTSGGATFTSPEYLAVNSAGTFLYITEEFTGNIYYCTLINGDVGTCKVGSSSGSLGIAVNPSDTFLYTTRFGNTVSKCPIHSDGSLGACTDAASGFFATDAVSINAAGTIAYVIDAADSVFECSIQSDGNLTGCISTGSGFQEPILMAINWAGTMAYIINANDDSLSQCAIAPDGSLINCSVFTGASFNSERGISINPTDTFAYLANNGDDKVLKCPINSGGSLVDPCTSIGSGFSQPFGISVAPGF